MQRKGIKRLIASVTEEFSTNVLETVVFLLALCVPILDIYLVARLGFCSDAPPLKKAFIRASLILLLILAIISAISMFIVFVYGVAVVKEHFGW